MIKHIIFDLDGVLVESKYIHFTALNRALRDIDSKYIITYDEHLGKYDGLSTKKKLEMLTLDKGLPKNNHERIWLRKQEITENLVENFKEDKRIIDVLDALKKKYT